MKNGKINISGHIIEGLVSGPNLTLHINTRQLKNDGLFGSGKIELSQRNLLEMQELLNPDYFEQMLNIIRREKTE